MFGKNKKTPENSAIQPFLNAQAERIERKYGNTFQPTESTLGQIVDDSPKPIDTGETEALPALEDKDTFVRDQVVDLMKLMQIGFEEAQAAGKHYDPLDDETFIGYEGYDAMTDVQKEFALKYLTSYLMSLELEQGKPLRYRTMGRHATGRTPINQQMSSQSYTVDQH